MDKKIILLSVVAVIAVAAAAGFVIAERGDSSVPSPEGVPHYELIGTVTHLADGDTCTIVVENIVADLDPAGEVYEDNSERIRFGGGIDAPETHSPPEPGGDNATYFVSSFLYPGAKVYLDLDNRAEGGDTGRPYRGNYERLIALVYTKFDNNWVNVNAQLLKWGMREFPGNEWDEYTDIDSEFDMYNWPPYDNNYPYVLSGEVNF